MRVLIYRMRADGTWPSQDGVGCTSLRVKDEARAMEAAVEFACGRSYKIEFFDRFDELVKVIEQAALPFDRMEATA
jgi:hypothetical protein